MAFYADYGICGFCKHLEKRDYAGLPREILPEMARNELCKKWQPPSSYGECLEGWRKGDFPFAKPTSTV